MIFQNPLSEFRIRQKLSPFVIFFLKPLSKVGVEEYLLKKKKTTGTIILDEF